VTQSEAIAVIGPISKGRLAMPRYTPTKINCNCLLQSIKAIALQVSQLGGTDADLAQALKMGLEPFPLTAEKLNDPAAPRPTNGLYPNDGRHLIPPRTAAQVKQFIVADLLTPRVQACLRAIAERGDWEVDADGVPLPSLEFLAVRRRQIDEYLDHCAPEFAAIPEGAPKSYRDQLLINSVVRAIGEDNHRIIETRARERNLFPLRTPTDYEKVLYDLQPSPGVKTAPLPRTESAAHATVLTLTPTRSELPHKRPIPQNGDVDSREAQARLRVADQARSDKRQRRDGNWRRNGKRDGDFHAARGNPRGSPTSRFYRRKSPATNGAQLPRSGCNDSCHRCRQPGHHAEDCPHDKITADALRAVMDAATTCRSLRGPNLAQLRPPGRGET